MTIKYDKLVRDRIPEIIEKRGSRCKTRTCGKNEIMKYLIKKLEEEVGEFRKKESLEEIADILEVCCAIIDEMGSTRKKVEEIRERKRKERGAFRRRKILIEATTRPPDCNSS